jgi:LL-diaminopimelate aminotransferase
MIQTATRLNGIGEYYFSQKLREIEELNKQGKNIINLGIGSPDLPPHPSVIEVLQAESAKPNTHAYQSYKGSAILRNAIANWYANWYNVAIDANTEVLPLIGSKEGIMHICMTYLESGKAALIPNPGYPTYSAAVKLAGGTAVNYNLVADNNWQPNMEELKVLVKNNNVALLFLNYPHMPTGQMASKEILEQLVQFAKEHDIILVHDNPYSFVLSDTPQSLLSINGAKDVAIELNSLSKSANMAGWRVGMMVAAKERIDEVLRFKSNMDSGMFLPIQLAAAQALSLGKDWYNSINAIYAERREKVYELLDVVGASFTKNQVGMFVWASIPVNYADGYAVSDEILYKANVFITPGGIFGTGGNNYIRISLCGSVQRFEEAIERIKNSKK